MALHPAEEATIQAFIAPERRARYLQKLADPRKRKRFLNRLNHYHDFDARFATQVHNMTVAELQSRGAPDRCYLISDSTELDGLELPLAEALQETGFHGWGTIICCIPGRLAYYRGEHGERENILVR
jgi:hypothetical protein